MPFNPLLGVGMVWARQIGPEPIMLGSAFAFRSAESWLTAAHVVGHGEIERGNLAVVTYTPRVPEALIYWRAVEEVQVHPNADLALLRVTPMDSERGDDPAHPFWNYVGNYALGEDFMAFGFPESVFGDDGRSPTPRLFKGSYQRIFDYMSGHEKRHYVAGEMSIPAPAGLSGAPLFRPGAQQMVTAVVTENMESTTYLDAIEIVNRGGDTSTTRYEKVISYGVALMLDRVAEWLDPLLPPRDPSAP